MTVPVNEGGSRIRILAIRRVRFQSFNHVEHIRDLSCQSGVVTNIKFCSRHEMVPRQFGQTPHATRILNTQTEGFSCSKENNARTSLKLQPRPQLVIARWLLSQRPENIEMRNNRSKQFRDMLPRTGRKLHLGQCRFSSSRHTSPVRVRRKSIRLGIPPQFVLKFDYTSSTSWY